MANEELEQLKLEADSLGISYSANIGVKKLQEKVDEFYEKESKSADITKVKEEPKTEAEVKTLKEDARVIALRKIKEQERENGKSVVVKITMVDKREASTATDVSFNNGNYSMRVPLDTFVEMPKILVAQAEEAMALISVPKGDTSAPKMQKKYVVEYKR